MTECYYYYIMLFWNLERICLESWVPTKTKKKLVSIGQKNDIKSQNGAGIWKGPSRSYKKLETLFFQKKEKKNERGRHFSST